MNIPQKNEALLLEKAKKGDKQAFNLMVIKYQPRIMSVLYGFLKIHSDAEDLTQQTFIKAWTNLEKFRGDSSFYTWIYRIAINLAKNFVKKPSTIDEKHQFYLMNITILYTYSNYLKNKYKYSLLKPMEVIFYLQYMKNFTM